MIREDILCFICFMFCLFEKRLKIEVKKISSVLNKWGDNF